MPFVRHLGKTNMITYIPQDINLELKDGVLTLKAGSKVYVPNGFEEDGTTPKFDYVTTEGDLSWAVSTTAGTRLGFFTGAGSSFAGCVNTYMYSGNTATMNSTSAVTYGRFYNTETNKIYVGNSNGGSWVETSGNSLPVGIFVNDSTGKVTEVSQVFNGFGYIGSTVFALPNVKGLIPNGFNADGSLNNIEFAVDSVLTRTYSSSNGTYVLRIHDGDAIYATSSVVYKPEENLIYVQDSAYTSAVVGEVVYSSGTVTSLTPKKVWEGIIKNKLYQLAAVKDGRLVSYSPIVRGSRTYYKQDLSQRDTGTYTFTLNKDYTAKMLFVGNGGGGGSCQMNSKWYQSSGGSGACFNGLVNLKAGTYTVTIGTLGYGYNKNDTSSCNGGVDSTDSYITDQNGNELIRVGCGARGVNRGSGGAGGTLTLGTLDVIETYKAVNGNKGNNLNPGSPSSTSGYALSAYDNTTTGCGAGTGSWRNGGNVYGVAGIFDLALETDINNYTYYEDVGTKIY